MTEGQRTDRQNAEHRAKHKEQNADSQLIVNEATPQTKKAKPKLKSKAPLAKHAKGAKEIFKSRF